MKFEQESESFRPINITIETEAELEELVDILESGTDRLSKDGLQLLAFLKRVGQWL